MDAKTREYIMSRRSLRFHMFIKHKETQHVHRMDMEFSNSTERDKFVQDLPEVLEFIKCEKVSSFYRA
jgi:hypothetical protein